jgi:ketosteroid isomerase-like protein
MAFVGPVEDRLAIHELVVSYGDAVTRRDVDDWGGNWAEDGFWAMPDFPGWEKIEGKDVIVSTWVDAMEGFPLNINVATLASVQVKGDQATGHAYTSELVCEPGGEAYRVTGRYDDEYVKQNGRWLFRRRVFKVLHQG